ncbi:MAG: hypothetical protein M3Y08_19680 [Fibrobacterota bacterium]|nr:hypothetical protein [Fibrobacterota bacterium]
MLRFVFVMAFWMFLAEQAHAGKYRSLSDQSYEEVRPQYIIDDETTVQITGEDTTRITTEIKNRSSQKVSESIDRLTNTIRFIFGFSVLATIVVIIFT